MYLWHTHDPTATQRNVLFNNRHRNGNTNALCPAKHYNNASITGSTDSAGGVRGVVSDALTVMETSAATNNRQAAAPVCPSQ